MITRCSKIIDGTSVIWFTADTMLSMISYLEKNKRKSYGDTGNLYSFFFFLIYTAGYNKKLIRAKLLPPTSGLAILCKRFMIV